MNIGTRLFAAVALLALFAGASYAQSSDYETIQSFKKRHQGLSQDIASVQELAQCDTLGSEIGRLESEYAQSRALLNDGLYPESLETSILALREQLKKSTERLVLAEERRKDRLKIEEITRQSEADGRKIEVISKQNEEYRVSLDALTREVQELSARIQKLTDENTGLLGSIKALQLESRKDKESIAKLRELTDKLNANIRDRDELIVKMMGSLFDEYAKGDLTEVQKKNLLTIAQDNDYVSNIVTTVDGNIEYVTTARLTPQDVKVIRDQQGKISVTWDGIKPFLGKLYPDEQTRARDITTVDGRLLELKRGTDEAAWRGMHQVFTENNVAVAAFHSGAEFSANLLAYIDEQLKNPSRQQHQAFRRKVWDSPIKDQWLPLVSTSELTDQQRGDIEARIALWDKKIASLFWRWVIAGIVGAALVAVIVVLARRKKQPATAA